MDNNNGCTELNAVEMAGQSKENEFMEKLIELFGKEIADKFKSK